MLIENVTHTHVFWGSIYTGSYDPSPGRFTHHDGTTRTDGRTTIERTQVEEVELPVEKVDIIVSEWMGHLEV